jgi:hypothetical protein
VIRVQRSMTDPTYTATIIRMWNTLRWKKSRIRTRFLCTSGRTDVLEERSDLEMDQKR